MTRIIGGIMLLLSSSLAATILGKATVIVTLGLLGAWLTRRRRAAVRHAVLAASFAVLVALPIASTLIAPVRIALPASTQEWVPLSLFPAPLDATQAATSVDRDAGVAPATPRRRELSPSAALLVLWIAGAAFFLLRMIFGLQQVRTLRRFGLPWRSGQSVVDRLALDAGIYRTVEVLLHESLPAPVTCGIVRPAIVLPPDIQEWEGEDLTRAIVHELEHVRRFDWAGHCLARIACAVYWFHPLVWAAWRQLALEAEHCCDDAVLTRSEATAYADQLVGLARRLSIAQPPALAMANRSDLSARVGSVLDGSRARGRAGALLATVACAVAAALVLTMSPLRIVAAPQSAVPAQNESKRKFEVASVKPADTTDLRASIQPDGDRFLASATLKALIGFAYDVEGHDIVGGPSWMTSGAWVIDARTGGATKPPLSEFQQMLQSLLSDRFKLAVHRETREESVYELLPAKSGSKLKASASPGSPRLHNGRGQMGGQSADTGILARMLSGRLGRVVIDKTGLTGRYDFELTWVPAPGERDDGAIAGSISNPEAPTLFTALQEQLGLRLQSAKGPVQYLVIDHAEKSTPN